MHLLWHRTLARGDPGRPCLGVLCPRGVPVLLLATVTIWLGMAQAWAASEYEVKAAFLYNFAKFVEWPDAFFAGESKPLVVGILGEDPFGNALPSVVEHETVKGHSVEVRHYHGLDEVVGCHVLFISRSETNRLKEVLRALDGRPMLTVGEADDFLSHGGMIRFVLVDKSVRFDINTQAVTQAGLKISSKLLAVARSIRP